MIKGLAMEEGTSSNEDIVFVTANGLTAPFLVVCSKVELALRNGFKVLLVKDGLVKLTFFFIISEVQGVVGGCSSSYLWDRSVVCCLFRRGLPVIDIGIYYALLTA